MPHTTNTTDLPFVSVVIPALNCIQEVDDCIAALQAQDYPADRFEIIVADNGSTDGTAERVQALGVQLERMPEKGRSKAQNAGLKVARGEIILTTDMGCIARPNWISNVVACFRDPMVGCVAGDIAMLPTGDNLALRFQARKRYMSPLHALKRRRLPFLPFADGANASFRRAVFDEIGGFESSFFKAADVEICYRILVLTEWKIVFCPDCLMEEAGEPDLKTLQHQRYRMGLGSHLLRARFPAFFEGAEESGPAGLRQRYWAYRERLGEAGRWLGALLSLDRAYLEDWWVSRLMAQAQARGESEGAAYLGQQPVKPTPVDDARQRAFMARMDRLDERVLVRRAADTPGPAGTI
ncbi:MAG: glycosyltransferase [Pseudomonadales bacterium]|nr:glycosyltransferase [Pseudomonadales bacterium]